MSTEDEMTIDERRKYLRKRQQRYAKADQTEKGKLLDEMEQVTNLHRKYLIALMRGDLKRKPLSWPKSTSVLGLRPFSPSCGTITASQS
jgi:hypothetical protein